MGGNGVVQHETRGTETRFNRDQCKVEISQIRSTGLGITKEV
jgi:hypothetical protein